MSNSRNNCRKKKHSWKEDVSHFSSSFFFLLLLLCTLMRSFQLHLSFIMCFFCSFFLYLFLFSSILFNVLFAHILCLVFNWSINFYFQLCLSFSNFFFFSFSLLFSTRVKWKIKIIISVGIPLTRTNSICAREYTQSYRKESHYPQPKYVVYIFRKKTPKWNEKPVN